MEKIIGTNLGNWLVLEEWMQPEMFSGVKHAPDETWLNRKMDRALLERRMKEHRDTYITKEDFVFIKEHGMNLIRLPLPYFVFGNYGEYIGCIEYVDKAFEWARETGLKLLLDLHTVPYGQNGYDNGGITGVCKFNQHPEAVEFALEVLETLAKRYKDEEALFGIEVLNEPISKLVWITSPQRKHTVDWDEAKGSNYIPMRFLKNFYRESYKRLRAILPEDKVIVFHDGFRLLSWNRFFRKEKMSNVMLDSHIYIFAMEGFFPFGNPFVYRIYTGFQRFKIRMVKRAVPVVVGEWCICNKHAFKRKKSYEKAMCFRELANREMECFSESAGHIYWSYKLIDKLEDGFDAEWKTSWDLRNCFKENWIRDMH